MVDRRFNRWKLVGRLCGVKQLEHIIPLRLTGVESVYCLPAIERRGEPDADKIKTALHTDFATDKFAASKQFIARRMQPDESVYVCQPELRKLAVLFSAVSIFG